MSTRAPSLEMSEVVIHGIQILSHLRTVCHLSSYGNLVSSVASSAGESGWTARRAICGMPKEGPRDAGHSGWTLPVLRTGFVLRHSIPRVPFSFSISKKWVSRTDASGRITQKARPFQQDTVTNYGPDWRNHMMDNFHHLTRTCIGVRGTALLVPRLRAHALWLESSLEREDGLHNRSG
jgi:hypothetical protein